MKKITTKITFLIILAMVSCSSLAEFKVGWGTGYAHNAFKGISFKMADGSTADYDGDLKTQPFQTPPYYQVMITHWAKNSGFQLELIHNKVYATDPLPQDFQKLEITDGYNMLFANVLIPIDNSWHFKMGAGAIITHIDLEYQNTRIHGPYEMAGYALQLGVQKDIELYDYFNFFINAATTYSQATPHINHPDLESMKVSGFSFFINTGFEIGN